MQYYTIPEGFTDECTEDQVCIFIHLQAEQIYHNCCCASLTLQFKVLKVFLGMPVYLVTVCLRCAEEPSPWLGGLVSEMFRI